MKILLREYGREHYVWKTAKYDGKKFVVDGKRIDPHKIISVMNDNRKNIIKCSCCGELFPKNGKKFARHQALSATTTPCMSCAHMCGDTYGTTKYTYKRNADGSFTQTSTTLCDLVCTQSWVSIPITSQKAINNCRKRHCTNAVALDIKDAFTEYPGLFDDILTVDRILDHGYERISFSDQYITEYVLSEELEIAATVDNLGIVSQFIIHGITEYGDAVWYSKKYKRLFISTDYDYVPYACENIDEINKYLENLYK